MSETPILFSIALLLPLGALLTVLQRNPYNALISRGVLGAVSALAYASLGAADVAVTEALMGSLLIIVLYTIAVRATMVIRLGV
ncbi:MAG TPA: hydrogenase subunit MbhD domain-containing protein, partial [Tichowtungia sp.]|nr:hydrogenase subunit MbhD domain-containing protein [Tichowtungia sp.]